MKPQDLPAQELIYYLNQKIKECFLAYAIHMAYVCQQNHFEEHYKMEKEIVSWMIREILNTGEYTLEGIASYIRVPLDVLSDVAMGMQKECSITLWLKIADLFLQLKKRC